MIGDIEISEKEAIKISEKIFSGKRLNFEDALILYKSNNILEIARLANFVKNKRYGEKVYYIINQHIDYTNICKVGCPLCAFARDDVDKDAYLLSAEEIISTINNKALEFHIVGGINKNVNLNYFVNLFKKLKNNFPHASIKALTAVEIDFLSAKEKKPVEEVLKILKEAGLDMMPGGGAEIFSARVRKIICPNKISGERWLEIHEIAHKLSIPTNATMLYGHVETIEERVEHLFKLRELQDKTKGFLAFIPLSFHPKHTKFDYLNSSTGYDDLKTIAISRLILDNIPHIKAYWVMLSAKLAQISLYFGADDIDGTIVNENIFHSAGSESSQYLLEEELINLIKGASRIPVLRDSFYRELRVSGKD